MVGAFSLRGRAAIPCGARTYLLNALHGGQQTERSGAARLPRVNTATFHMLPPRRTAGDTTSTVVTRGQRSASRRAISHQESTSYRLITQGRRALIGRRIATAVHVLPCVVDEAADDRRRPTREILRPVGGAAEAATAGPMQSSCSTVRWDRTTPMRRRTWLSDTNLSRASTTGRQLLEATLATGHPKVVDAWSRIAQPQLAARPGGNRPHDGGLEHVLIRGWRGRSSTPVLSTPQRTRLGCEGDRTVTNEEKRRAGRVGDTATAIPPHGTARLFDTSCLRAHALS
jgi:hypothetical protein